MSESGARTPPLRAALEGYRWEGVESHAYKDEAAAPFRNVTRQTLASDPSLAGELRYFEVEPSGYSTLERHEHMHSVMILRGQGKVLVGDEVFAVKPHDLVTIGSWTWHQFRAAPSEKLGFLCLVNATRDRPQLPTPDDLAALRANPAIARFLDGAGD
jgi:quercetin dioxygenase-like cupin family protein